MSLNKIIGRLEEEYENGFSDEDWRTDEELQKTVNYIFQELDLENSSREDVMGYLEDGEYEAFRQEYEDDLE